MYFLTTHSVPSQNKDLTWQTYVINCLYHNMLYVSFLFLAQSCHLSTCAVGSKQIIYDLGLHIFV